VPRASATGPSAPPAPPRFAGFTRSYNSGDS
jgi:hypothetical protein